MTSESVLQLQGVSKSFGGRAALEGVSLSVTRGEMVALIGPSGSGKSTLLRTVTGMVCAEAGRVEAFGRPVQADGRVSPGVRELRRRTGFVAQQFNLVGRLSLYANVLVGALGRLPAWRGLLGVWPRAERELAMAAMARVGLAELAGQRAATLSGGQQQRGAVARALVQGAELLLADEPVASLDPVSARRVLQLLAALNREEGLTVVVSLHQVDYALRYCRRVVALKAGRVVYDGPSEGLGRDLLVEVYGPEIADVFWEETAA